MEPSDRSLHLVKLHGAGNDFLVLLDPGGYVSLSTGEVRALCDRHRGIGADGLIRAWKGTNGADIAMELRNADGSAAELSGNGMRCLAMAAVDAGMVAGSLFTIETAAGIHHVEYRSGESSTEGWAAVDMGTPCVGPEERSEWWNGPLRRVDVGNPHVVALGERLTSADLAATDLAAVGPRLAGLGEAEANVEVVVTTDAPDELIMRVWERGVGETMACGSGTVAAAAAAAAWGLVGRGIRVRNPGGVLEVALGSPPTASRLSGPVRKVAHVEVDRDVLS